MSTIADKAARTTETACKANGMAAVHAETNSTNISVIRITESTHHTFIVDMTQIRIQAFLRRKTKNRRKKKLIVEATTVEAALATLPLTSGERSV